MTFTYPVKFTGLIFHLNVTVLLIKSVLRNAQKLPENCVFVSRYILYDSINISFMHVKGGLMSSKVRLDIANHSISLITIDFYIVWIIHF